MTPDQKQALINYLSQFINEQRRNVLLRILEQRTRYLTVVLEDIYYPQNASAVLRTCECLGLQELHIIENKHNYRVNPDIVRGAAKWLDIFQYKEKTVNNTEPCLQGLRQRSYKIVAMTLEDNAIPLDELPVDHKLALCFGTEETGLSETVTDMTDYHVKIPMSGFTQSFNLSVSAGISLFTLTEKIRTAELDWQLDSEDRLNLHIDWLVKSTPTGEVLKQKFLGENYSFKNTEARNQNSE